MRPTAIRRTAVAATVMSLALLTAACGSDAADKDGGDKGKADGTPSAKPAAAKVLTAAELEKVSLAQGDVKGHKVSKAGPQDAVSADDVTADKAACDVFADALMGAKSGSPAASTQRKVISVPKKGADQDSADLDESFEAAFDITTTLTTLSSYEGKGAEESLAGLRTAATGCASGFTLTAAGSKQKIVKIAEEQVKGGEDAAGWTVTIESDGDKTTMKLVQVRQGATLASFSALNMAAAASGKDFELPTAVIDAQSAKLA
uniref:Lipoprotein n=1 Tax=Streptomyces sp. NBC_00008 TaxID=2903610 RepID=A0AAU2VTK4_9ACTN